MKTTVTHKDGLIETFPDAAPCINPEENHIYMVDKDNLVLTADFAFDTILRVEFEI